MSLGQENEFQAFKAGLSDLDAGLISLSAMLNRNGKGTVYFGVNTEGIVCGVNVDVNAMAEIRNKLSKLKPGFSCTIDECAEGAKSFIKIAARGDDRPYSYDGRYYLRNAASDEQATNGMLRRMLISGDTDLIRQIPSELQQLTFAGLFSILAAQGLHVSDSEECRRSLNLFNAEDKFNLMAYLLSDQNAFPSRSCALPGSTSRSC